MSDDEWVDLSLELGKKDGSFTISTDFEYGSHFNCFQHQSVYRPQVTGKFMVNDGSGWKEVVAPVDPSNWEGVILHQESWEPLDVV